MSNKDKKGKSDKSKKQHVNKKSFSAGLGKKTKFYAIVGSIIAVFVALIVYSSYAFIINSKTDFGPLGSAHTHSAFLIKLNGKPIDFSQDKYQVKSKYIHVENGDGFTLHRHAENVTFNAFIHSVNMDIEDKCFNTDDGRQYCESPKNKLRYFINGNETRSDVLSNYIPNDNDRILILYGNETTSQIRNELEELKKIPIKVQ